VKLFGQAAIRLWLRFSNTLQRRLPFARARMYSGGVGGPPGKAGEKGYREMRPEVVGMRGARRRSVICAEPIR
jgi:hypothetical protein